MVPVVSDIFQMTKLGHHHLSRQHNWEAYTDYYREYLRENWQRVKAWLQSLNDAEDVYLCCWERTPDHCHRSLVAKMIRLHRPDLEVELK